MKRLLFAALAAVVSITISGGAMADLVVASGTKDGTYDTMIHEVVKVCQAPALTISESSGSSETIAKLLGNKINAGIVQVDALALRQMSDNQVNSLRTLVALHPEEVHVVVRADAALKSGGVMGFGGTKTPLQTVDQIAGMKVGAWGGSVGTAQLIQSLGQVNFTLTEYENREKTLEAFNSGTVDVIIAVGGQPLGWLDKAPAGAFRLLAFSDQMRGRLQQVYKPATLYYRNLGAEGLPTVSTDALLVTRDYKSGAKVAELNQLRQCIFDNLGTFQEEVGYHPKWQGVDPENKGRVIPYFSVTAPQAAPAPGGGQTAPVSPQRH